MRLANVRPEVIVALTRTPEIKKQVRAVAAGIRDDARARAPRRTGALRRSIKVDNILDDQGRVVFRVGWDRRIAFYGPMVEGGTEHSRSRPHLQPAAERYRSR